MVILGMMFFTLGAETSMTPMGEAVGAKMTQSKNVFLIVNFCINLVNNPLKNLKFYKKLPTNILRT